MLSTRKPTCKRTGSTRQFNRREAHKTLKTSQRQGESAANEADDLPCTAYGVVPKQNDAGTLPLDTLRHSHVSSKDVVDPTALCGLVRVANQAEESHETSMSPVCPQRLGRCSIHGQRRHHSKDHFHSTRHGDMSVTWGDQHQDAPEKLECVPQRPAPTTRKVNAWPLASSTSPIGTVVRLGPRKSLAYCLTSADILFTSHNVDAGVPR